MPPLGPPHVKGCPALVTAPPHSLTPKEFGDEIEKATGVRYSKSHLYALLAALRLSPKTPTMTHVNRASRRSVLRWQRRVRKRIDRLRERGYTVVAVDEAFLVYNTIRGRKHWTLVGKRVPQVLLKIRARRGFLIGQRRAARGRARGWRFWAGAGLASRVIPTAPPAHAAFAFKRSNAARGARLRGSSF